MIIYYRALIEAIADFNFSLHGRDSVLINVLQWKCNCNILCSVVVIIKKFYKNSKTLKALLYREYTSLHFVINNTL